MVASRFLLVPVAALVASASAAVLAMPQAARPGAPLLPLREADVDPYAKELPGENMGDGGEFSMGRARLIRLEGRHLTFRTAAGVRRCVVTAAAASAWTVGDKGRVGCGDVSLAKAPDPGARDDAGQPAVITVAQGKRTARLKGLWQGLE